MGLSSRVLEFYDKPMWESIDRRQWALQYCPQSNSFRYPPSPVCPISNSLEFEWKPIKGTGEIISWVIFHHDYFDDYKAPYNVVAVRLDEGPIVISNLVGEPPEGTWIGHRVEVVYEEHQDYVLPRMRLAGS